MFRKILGIYLLCLFLHSGPAGYAAEYKIDAAQSEIKFSVSASVYTIRGKAQQAESRVSFERETGRVTLPMKIEIPVESLKTKNKLRDKDMRKMFDSKQFPMIVWTASEVECEARNTEGAFACTGKGILTIKGKEKKVIFPVDLQFEEGRVRASGLLTVQRKDFDLKTPSMLGMIRVGQEITVEFNTLWVSA